MLHGQKVEKSGTIVQFGLVLFWLGGWEGILLGQQLQPESQVVPEREMREEQLAEIPPTRESDLKLTGYVDTTYLYNFGSGTATSPLDFPADTIPRGDFNLSALWLRLDKPLRKENTLEAGLQAGLMLGEDATYFAAAGLPYTPDGPACNALYLGEALVKFWVPDVQMEMWVGKYQAIIGYETIWRPDNPCITFGIANAFLPQDNVGFLAIFSPDPLLDLGVGLANCSGASNDLGRLGSGDEAAVMAYAIVRNPEGNALLQPVFYVTPWGVHGSNARIDLDQNFYYNWELVGDWQPAFAGDLWRLTLDVTGGSGTGDPGIEAPTTFVTGALYSTWTLIDPVTLTGRAEYVHTSNYVLPMTSRLSGGDYYDYTLTLSVKITEELVWRGEGRLAWGVGTTLSSDSSLELAPPASDALWTLATEIYYRF